ncbi:flagellar hook protein FlgE [Alishewanella sp. WH16-1]|uniref:flagellar hook protein FlgE n=1 Tax=Alishewanella sp. WH16-1 TaxID=1651088 RepID=UPI0007093381|nr:flagellar hook protein FlgE [Alishewanella sp. WH16-1]KRS22796.1 flagellar hook protein FlgE [Alishewanella sp. WH16-1]
MSFQIALSGIAAAQKDLDTTANNIANVNTTGFKESRAEFADVYASSVFQSAKTKVGDGVRTASIAQQFQQGSLQFTNNALDLAITGDGFFVTASEIGSRDYGYTRAGAFKLDKNNFLVNNNGDFLQGYPVDRSTGSTTSVSLSTTNPIQIPTTAGAPSATRSIFLSMNLDSRATTPTTAFSVGDRSSYNSTTSTTVYDSLGQAHIISLYFVREAPLTDNTWSVYSAFDGDVLNSNAPISTLQFTPSGIPVGSPNPFTDGILSQTELNGLLQNGATFPQDVTVRYQDESGTRNPTQYSSNFEVGTLSQNGTTVGRLTGLDIDTGGRLMATYSNGDQQYLAQVSMVRFANPQGLNQVGNTSWKASLASGEPLAGEPNTGTFGSIQSSALEQSNVNLTTELVDLINAQRNFQANSRALEVNSSLQQTILQIR